MRTPNTPTNEPHLSSEPPTDSSLESLTMQCDAMKRQLRHAQKLAALGTTSAMLAHEYNNVLTPVISYAQYALDKNDVKLMRKTLNLVLKQHSAIQVLSDRILGMARQVDRPEEPVFIKQTAEDAIACLGRDLSKDGIDLRLEIDESVCVRGRSDQLQQVFFNLVLNARQAMLDQQGLLKITATVVCDSTVTVHIRDNGRGISAENLDKIFDPFFSTKGHEKTQEKRGIGLGLAICKDIIEEHGGTMNVESIEGHGTTFSLTLPLMK